MRRPSSFLSITAFTVLSTLAVGGMTPASCEASAAGLTGYTGEVWVWDEQTGVVTLRQTGGGMFRVQMTPAETRRLRLHEVTTG